MDVFGCFSFVALANTNSWSLFFNIIVGQLPVLRPGQCFEYTSGSDLASPKGIMKGHFYMAWVPPESPSAKAGDNIEILNNLQEEDKLQAIVAPFPLEAK
jgi:hypothetical protein